MQKDKKTKRAMRWRIYLFFISWLSYIVPLIIYNSMNFKIYKDVSPMKFTFSGLVALSLLGLATLIKLKSKSSVIMIAIGCVLAIMGEIAVQIGCSLLIIGIAKILDQTIWSPLSLKCKEVYYNGTGRTISYTRSIN